MIAPAVQRLRIASGPALARELLRVERMLTRRLADARLQPGEGVADVDHLAGRLAEVRANLDSVRNRAL